MDLWKDLSLWVMMPNKIIKHIVHDKIYVTIENELLAEGDVWDEIIEATEDSVNNLLYSMKIRLRGPIKEEYNDT